VLGEQTTHVRRDAGPDQSFGAITSNGVVVAAASFDSIARMAPAISCSNSEVSIGWFDDIAEPTELVAELRRLLDDAPPVECLIELASTPYPGFPSHDVRASQRQCVALGAAVGAAGLAGRLRPVDISMPDASTSSEHERPWAIERVSDLPAARSAPKIGRSKRAVARLLPRRR
jgi:hypothetical protein